MATRLPSLLHPPILFAHRGARAECAENTLDAFRRALELGATGLESDVWLTSDGVPVLNHAGVIRRGLRRIPVARFTRSELPPEIASLADLYETVGCDLPLSLDLKDPAAVGPVLDVAGEAGAAAVSRLWLCHPDWEVVAGWRRLDPSVHLVDSTRLRRIREGVERRAAALQHVGIDALNLRQDEWTGGLVSLLHRFGRLALGWDAQHAHQIEALFDIGIDAVYSDHSDRMVEAWRRFC